MLLLYEAPAGYLLFKVLDESKLKNVENIWKEFETPTSLHSFIKMDSFLPFKDTTEAVSAASSLIKGKVSKQLRKFLKKAFLSNTSHTLAVADSKLSSSIKDKLKLNCITPKTNPETTEILRGLRAHLTELFPDLKDSPGASKIHSMELGLGHSLSRYKLKFTADKVDQMIVQSINLLDELDKEINTYAMRVREWYGWHFPELTKLVSDNIFYCKLILATGKRDTFKSKSFEDFIKISESISETEVSEIKQTCEISMGTDISDADLTTIRALCEEVVELSSYRNNLYAYLSSRMNAIAPNLTILLGELVGARLIAHSGSLLNLAKQAGSTVQILGAEKALFRALKSSKGNKFGKGDAVSNTPKYGLIYHSSLIGQATGKNKGKISRMLASKAALAIRVDALSEVEEGREINTVVGYEGREKVENRLRVLENKDFIKTTGSDANIWKPKKYEKNGEMKELYKTDVDVVGLGRPSGDKKRKIEEVESYELQSPKQETHEGHIENGIKIQNESKKKDKKLKKEGKKKKLVEEITVESAKSDRKKKKQKENGK